MINDENINPFCIPPRYRKGGRCHRVCPLLLPRRKGGGSLNKGNVTFSARARGGVGLCVACQVEDDKGDCWRCYACEEVEDNGKGQAD